MARCATYQSDIPTWISHHLSSVGYLEYIKIPLEESVYQYEIAQIGIKDVSNPTPFLYSDSSIWCGFFLSWPCVPTPNVRLDVWDCVDSYAIHMILARWLRITLKPKTKLIIFKQGASSSVLPLITEESPLFVFKVCLHSRILRILLNSKLCLCQEVCFAKAKIFLYQAIQSVVHAELAQARFLRTKNFCTLQFFSSHHSSGWVPTSLANVFVQEAHAQYWTLAVRQKEYYPQVSQWVEKF